MRSTARPSTDDFSSKTALRDGGDDGCEKAGCGDNGAVGDEVAVEV
jgi:hypothetical protein